MKKVTSRNGKYYYIEEISIADMLHAGWLTLHPHKEQEWLPFAFWEVKALEERTEPTPDEIERYYAKFPAEVRAKVEAREAPEYWVSDVHNSGGIPDKFTLTEARRIAHQMSIDGSEVVAVTRDLTYTPIVIFHSGREYRPVEGE